MAFSLAGLRWREPEVTVNYRPVLSSERALQNNKPADYLKKISRRKKNWSRVPDGCLTPRQAGRLTVGNFKQSSGVEDGINIKGETIT
jgi:hypothetical protein